MQMVTSAHGENFPWVFLGRQQQGGGARHPTRETLFDVSSRRPVDILLLLSPSSFAPSPSLVVVFLFLGPPSPAF
jgi:hypothetical protein